jgi:uncharacterized protein YjiS (DUF1127 family)
MSAPLTKSQMAFELPKLSYIDTRWEEPDVRQPSEPVREHGFVAWIAASFEAIRARREQARAVAELNNMTDRELLDVGLSRGDFARIFDDRFNRDLVERSRAF